MILLNSVKAVAESLAGLINSTRINSNHQFNPQVIDQLRQLSTGTVFSITKLVKTVQIVRDDQLKGPTALKSTISVLQNKSEVGQNSVYSEYLNFRRLVNALKIIQCSRNFLRKI